MENVSVPSPEEMQKLIEKAQQEVQAALAKMTPEERAQAESRAQKLMEEDRASMQRLMDEAAKVAAGDIPKAKAAPKFCTNCGAPVSGGKFCTSCGSPLYAGD